jgi:hypothetical protein
LTILSRQSRLDGQALVTVLAGVVTQVFKILRQFWPLPRSIAASPEPAIAMEYR